MGNSILQTDVLIGEPLERVKQLLRDDASAHGVTEIEFTLNEYIEWRTVDKRFSGFLSRWKKKCSMS